jgi:hypothetical protein
MPEKQTELPFSAKKDGFEIRPDDPNILFLVEQLAGSGWRTAKELSASIEARVNVGRKVGERYLRALASASGGQIAGGQRGYKLVREMTVEEYQHWRNWMKSQSDEMCRRVLQSDKVFYGRQPVKAGNGIL